MAMSVRKEELFQGCSEQGEFTDAGLRREQIKEGALHASSHVWIVRRRDGSGCEVLLQLRAHDKPTWPGFWDISAAGHVDFGESPLSAVKREAEEEISLLMSDVHLNLLFVRKDKMMFNDFIENEFRWVYLYEWQDEQTELLDGEVEKLEWVSFEQFFEMTGNPDTHRLVNQSVGYFNSLNGYLTTYADH